MEVVPGPTGLAGLDMYPCCLRLNFLQKEFHFFLHLHVIPISFYCILRHGKCAAELHSIQFCFGGILTLEIPPRKMHSIQFCFDGILRLENAPRKNAQHSVLLSSHFKASKMHRGKMHSIPFCFSGILRLYNIG